MEKKENIFDWFKWFGKSIKININLSESNLKVIDAVYRRTQHEITILNCKTSFIIDIHVTPTSYHIGFHRAKCGYLLKIQRCSLTLLGFADCRYLFLNIFKVVSFLTISVLLKRMAFSGEMWPLNVCPWTEHLFHPPLVQKMSKKTWCRDCEPQMMEKRKEDWLVNWAQLKELWGETFWAHVQSIKRTRDGRDGVRQ